MIVRLSILSGFLLGCLIFMCTASPTKRNEDDQIIVKSASDENEYRVVTLSNELRCVVVSDTSTEIAAVQLQLGVGSLSEDTPGLAHLVEHLIFFGSVEYPDGKLYTDYLEENGGQYNGFTGQTYTGYTFYVNNRSWAKAAKMLASLIGEPLFSRDLFESAIEAVDSEYRIRIRNDRRSLRTLALELSNPESRDSGFTVGSRETLNVTDIYEQVVDFHDRYYSANLMTLAVVANDTLDSLEALAEEMFGNIPNNNREVPTYLSVPFPTENKQFLGKKIYYQKKETGHKISIFFPVNLKNYPSVGYIRYLLVHKGSGSIYQYLLARGYITTSWIVTSPLVDSQKTSVTVDIGATEKGIADPEFIADTVFKYLKAACSDGVNVQLWNSINEIKRLKFRFQDKKYPTTIAYYLISNMAKRNDSRRYLNAPSEENLDIALENQILEYFNPDNFNLYVGSDSFSNLEAKNNGPLLTKSEYYYNTPYFDGNFTEEQLGAWRDAETDPELHLPLPNDLVAKNLDIFQIEKDAGELPLEIVNRNEGDVSNWWFQDQEWKKPKTIVKCKIYPSHVARDAKATAIKMMIDKMFDLVKDLAFYDAKEVDFQPAISFKNDWVIYLSGYSDPDKVEAVISKMVDALFSLNFQMDEAHYNATVLKPTQRAYDESDDSAPKIAFKYVKMLIYEIFVDPVDVIDEANKISQSDIKDFADSFLKDISLICTAMGNVRKDHAIRYSRIIRDKLVEKGSLITNEDRRSLTEDMGLFKLPPGPSHVIRRRMENPEAETSAIIVGFQIGLAESTGSDSEKPPYTVYALTELLGLMMGPTCFDYLRTKKQLGYSASCFRFERFDVTHFIFHVQGSREGAGPHVMNQEINNLIAQQQETFRHLAGTPEGLDKFNGAKETLKERIYVFGKHRSLKERAVDFMNQIFSSKTDFDIIEKKIAAVEAITVEEFGRFYEEYIAGETRRTFSSQVYGASHAIIPDTVEEGEILIEAIEAYKVGLTELF